MLASGSIPPAPNRLPPARPVATDVPSEWTQEPALEARRDEVRRFRSQTGAAGLPRDVLEFISRRGFVDPLSVSAFATTSWNIHQAATPIASIALKGDQQAAHRDHCIAAINSMVKGIRRGVGFNTTAARLLFERYMADVQLEPGHRAALLDLMIRRVLDAAAQTALDFELSARVLEIVSSFEMQRSRLQQQAQVEPVADEIAGKIGSFKEAHAVRSREHQETSDGLNRWREEALRMFDQRARSIADSLPILATCGQTLNRLLNSFSQGELGRLRVGRSGVHRTLEGDLRALIAMIAPLPPSAALFDAFDAIFESLSTTKPLKNPKDCARLAHRILETDLYGAVFNMAVPEHLYQRRMGLLRQLRPDQAAASGFD